MAANLAFPPEGGGEDRGNRHQESVDHANDGVRSGTYAKVAGNHASGRKKLNVLDIMLERRNNIGRTG